ncbi:uncharacterized protein LOC131003338 [Salvia miltiorrhiza]|uniref:uncharacterized protein LOC131003338 n=1 Tax=Salvia miltiorrhiza TaxID=226208 RepID=UPI0025AB7E8E|nr:uncharacterized protein LOC131003338 [Salvia miltiorrhiza]
MAGGPKGGIDIVGDAKGGVDMTATNGGDADDWSWTAAKDGFYSTRSAYEVIYKTRQERPASEAINDILSKVWKSPVPHKVRVTAWRTLRDRLPTCDNLRRRNILVDEVDLGCACFHNEETINHFLLHCPKTEKVWDDILRWLGMCFVRPPNVVSHFLSFTNLGNRKRSRKFLLALWCCVNWVVWRCRNVSRFENKGWDIHKVVSEIKVRMWSWGKIFDFLDLDSNLEGWLADASSLVTL